MRKWLLVTIVFFFTCFTTSFGQSKLTAKQLALLDSISTQDVPAGGPGIATAVIENGRTLYVKYCGIADFADSSLITAHSRFNLASNAKQFTALSILILADNRQIRLDDDIRKFLPEIYPGISDKISISNLLNHTSGIRDVYDLWSLQGITWWKKSFNNKDVLKLVQQQKSLNFLPGAQYLYSNTNYILLALIVEKVSGQSFVSFTNNMFTKLGMPHTSFTDQYDHITGPIARAYFNFDTWTTYPWIWNVCGDGNLFSTLPDQIQWEKIIQGKATTTIKKQLIQQSQQLINNSIHNNYGYGLEFGKYKGLDYKFHEGATGAWKATVTRFPVKNMSIITLTNTGKSIPAMQTRQMADILLNLKENAAFIISKPVKIGKYISEDDIVGTFLTDDNFTFQFEKSGSNIYLKRSGRNDILLEREADNIFHQKSDTAFKQEFTINSTGEMEVTAYYTTHQPYTLRRSNTNWAAFDYQALNGKYINGETQTKLDIIFKNDRMYTVKIGQQDSTMGLLISPTKLLADNYIIHIPADNSDTTPIYLNGDRIKVAEFIRIK